MYYTPEFNALTLNSIAEAFITRTDNDPCSFGHQQEGQR